MTTRSLGSWATATGLNESSTDASRRACTPTRFLLWADASLDAGIEEGETYGQS